MPLPHGILISNPDISYTYNTGRNPAPVNCLMEIIIKKANTSEITSLKDASYQGCTSSEKGITIGKYIHGKCPTFLESIPDEVRAEIEEGQMLRLHENHAPQYYSAEWIPVSEGTEGAFKVDINVVMAYSSQEFGKWRNEDPVKHGIHKSWRDDWSDYKSNRLKDLKKYVKQYKDLLDGKTKSRVATKDFVVWLAETVDTIKTRAKTAKGRGDSTVDDAVVSAIVKAIK